MMRDFLAFLLGVIVLFVGAIWLLYEVEQQEIQACEARSGRWVKVGSQTYYQKSGNLLIPFEVATYGCGK